MPRVHLEDPVKQPNSGLKCDSECIPKALCSDKSLLDNNSFVFEQFEILGALEQLIKTECKLWLYSTAVTIGGLKSGDLQYVFYKLGKLSYNHALKDLLISSTCSVKYFSLFRPPDWEAMCLTVVVNLWSSWIQAALKFFLWFVKFYSELYVIGQTFFTETAVICLTWAPLISIFFALCENSWYTLSATNHYLRLFSDLKCWMTVLMIYRKWYPYLRGGSVHG